MSYEEFMKLALEHYDEGGDCVYECWEEAQFDYYVKEFGAVTKKKALSIFAMYFSTRYDC